MSIESKRMVTGLLALTGLYVGAWASLSPNGFFTSFPGFGRHWVWEAHGFNEHLIRDVGAMYLALVLMSVRVVIRPSAESFVLVGLGWSAYNLIHAAFHLSHLGEYAVLDRWLNAITLLGVLALSLLLLLPTHPTEN